MERDFPEPVLRDTVEDALGKEDVGIMGNLFNPLAPARLGEKNIRRIRTHVEAPPSEMSSGQVSLGKGR